MYNTVTHHHMQLLVVIFIKWKSLSRHHITFRVSQFSLQKQPPISLNLVNPSPNPNTASSLCLNQDLNSFCFRMNSEWALSVTMILKINQSKRTLMSIFPIHKYRPSILSLHLLHRLVMVLNLRFAVIFLRKFCTF